MRNPIEVEPGNVPIESPLNPPLLTKNINFLLSKTFSSRPPRLILNTSTVTQSNTDVIHTRRVQDPEFRSRLRKELDFSRRISGAGPGVDIYD